MTTTGTTGTMSEDAKRALVLKIAAGYVGVKESPANSNNVIFNTWFYGKPVQDGFNFEGKPDKNARYPWCGAFVSKVFADANIPLGCIGYLRGFAGCPYAIANIHKWGVEVQYKDAKAGDIIFYDWNLDGKWDHTGILDAKGAAWFYAFEGNTALGNDSNGGEVMHRVDRKIFAGLKFVRPNCYNDK